MDQGELLRVTSLWKPQVSVEGYPGGIHLLHVDVIVEDPSEAVLSRG